MRHTHTLDWTSKLTPTGGLWNNVTVTASSFQLYQQLQQ